MSRRVHRLAATSLLLLVFGCGGETATAPKAIAPATVAIPKPVSLAIRPDTLVLSIGNSAQFTATETMSDGSRISVTAQWVSANAGVLTVDPTSGAVQAVGSGQTTIQATADGLTSAATVVVRIPPQGVDTSDVLAIQSFSVVEYKYESAPNNWYYAPQIRVAAGPLHGATVLSVSVWIPGFDGPGSLACGATVSSGGVVDLNGEVYGDWTWSIDQTVRRATASDATVSIIFVDDAGRTGTITARGPVVPGSLPSTYTGGRNGGGCFHGYRG